MKAKQLPSMVLAVALQVLPITRVFIAATPAATPGYAIISTWIAGAVALLGSYHAVSGASSISISPASATTGVPYSGLVQYSGSHASSARSWQLINNWRGAQSGCNTVYEIAPGLWLTNATTYLVRIGGTPTTSGTFSFTMRIHSATGCSGGDSDTRTTSITIIGGTATGPAITQQPTSQTVTEGGSASFSVMATGTAPLTYQWKRNNVNVPGGTSASLTLNPVALIDAGSYTCTVANSVNSVTSNPAILTVNAAAVGPSITSQPVSQTVTEGGTVSFSVTATGTAPLTYQWKRNNVNVPNGTTATLTLTGVTTNQAGNYTCTVGNSVSSVTSTPATLTVTLAAVGPIITTQPVNQTVTEGANVSFAVTATGTAPLTYQWKLNNVNVSGGTSATLALTAVTTNQAGSYTCTVGNSVASVTSSPAILIVNSVPVQLTNHPPVISAIPNQSTPLDTATPAIAFIVGDVETTASDLTLSAVSSNPALIPAANIAFGGSGANRTITLTPVTGQTGGSLITVYVTDGSSTSSTDFQLSVLTSTPSRVTVIINGNGTVVPDLSAATLTIGQTYRISARPGTDQIFAGWTGNVVSSSPTISFVMAPNLVFTANFVPNPYTAVAGQYNGLFYETDEVRQESAGFFDLAVTPRGTYSGNLKTGGSRYKLSGALDLQLRATNRIPRQTGNISVQLRLGANQDAGKVFGQVSDGNWVSPLLGDRAAFNSLNNPAPFASKYTLVIPGQADPSVPAGVGCGTVEIKTSGRVRFAAALADGTKTSQTTAISTGGHWPLYASFYSQRGLLLGWVAFENQLDSDLNGTLCWIKQADPLAKYYVAGFTNECGTIGSMYAPDHSTPTNLVNASRARVAFIGGNLARNLTNSVAIGSDGDGSDDDDDDVSLALSASKGTYSGKMKDPGTGKTFNFQGVVLQKQNVGLGFLLGTNQTSKVVVEPQARRAGDDDDDD